MRAAAARMEAQLAANPKDYQGWIRLAKAWAQLGDRAGARDALARGAQAYPGAPFVQQQLQAAAAELGIEPEDSATAPRGPTAEQMAAAETMSPEQRQEMVRAMVDGLAARLEQQPDDIEGWRMLGRSWAVLGDPAKSAEAFAQVAHRLPEDLASQVDYATALLARQSLDQPPSAEAVAQLQQVLKLDGDNPIALFHLGRAAAANGDTGTATRHWQRLLAHLLARRAECAAGAPDQESSGQRLIGRLARRPSLARRLRSGVACASMQTHAASVDPSSHCGRRIRSRSSSRAEAPNRSVSGEVQPEPRKWSTR